MKYVFDSDSLINLFRHYYPERFPTLWEKFDALVSAEELISVREVFNEIGSGEDLLAFWAKEQKNILFLESTPEELQFIGELFQVRHFQAMIRKQEIPNVCDHFGIPCKNLEEFMKKENWTF